MAIQARPRERPRGPDSPRRLPRLPCPGRLDEAIPVVLIQYFVAAPEQLVCASSEKLVDGGSPFLCSLDEGVAGLVRGGKCFWSAALHSIGARGEKNKQK